MRTTFVGSSLKASFIFLLLGAGSLVLAQEPAIEYGSPNELSGIQTIFVYTGPDLKAHNKITEHILKKLPGLRLANQPLEADVILAFVQESESYLAGVIGSSRSTGTVTTYGNRGTYEGSSSGRTTPVYRSVKSGAGMVVKLKRATESNPVGAIRLLMDFSDSKSTRLFEREPYTNFARAFVSAYEKANKR